MVAHFCGGEQIAGSFGRHDVALPGVVVGVGVSQGAALGAATFSV